MNTIRKAGALIFNGRRVLLVKPHKKPFFINPGGKYEGKEDAGQCLKRELKEELGVDLISFNHFKNYNIKKAAHDDQPLVLELYLIEINGNPKPSSEIETFEWIFRKDFENKKFNLSPSFNQIIPDLIEAELF